MDTETPMDDNGSQFVRLVAQQERSLRGFVRSLMPNSDHVDDIVQEVFVVAWKKFDHLQDHQDFSKWICAIAKFEVLNFRRRMARDRMVLNEDLIKLIADEGADQSEVRQAQLKALSKCVAELPDQKRNLIRQVYLPGIPISEVAAKFNKNENAVYQSLYRIRQGLWNCVSRRLQIENN